LQTKISTAAVCRPMHSNPEIFPKLSIWKPKALNQIQIQIWMFVRLQFVKAWTHLNPNLSPAKSVSGKPPKSFMSISFDSPSQSQVPNLIQYCSWDAVTAHSKRARIHIWRKSLETFLDETSWILLHMAGQERSFCTPLLKW